MKKIILSTLMVMAAVTLMAQRFAYIDSGYILDNIPEYAAVQKQLDQLSVEWQKDIEKLFAEVDKMYRDYQAEAVLLPENMKRQREDQIIEKERQAKELQMRRFGRDGELVKRRQELTKPIQDQIYNAIEEIATRGNYAVIFDKAGGANMIFSDVRYDLSDEVLQKMGYRK